MGIWHDIVDLNNKIRGHKEEDVQKTWESIFREFFNYSSLKGEIESKRAIHIGSKDKIIPDIILKKDNKDIMLVELKINSVMFNDKYKKQLFSYLKQLKINIGILICDAIYLYYYDYNKSDEEQIGIEIKILQDSPIGEEFVELVDKYSFEEDKVKRFILQQLREKEELKEIKEKINEDFIKELIRSCLLKNNYNENIIKIALDETNIRIEDKKQLSICIDNSLLKKETVIPVNNLKLDKGGAKQLCINNGISLMPIVTYASLGGVGGKYAADVRVDAVNYDWTIILEDQYSKKVHVFNIPANSCLINEFYIHPGKQKISLLINSSFVDNHPQNNKYKSLQQYKIKTIEY